jgi:hypothetical protein
MLHPLIRAMNHIYLGSGQGCGREGTWLTALQPSTPKLPIKRMTDPAAKDCGVMENGALPHSYLSPSLRLQQRTQTISPLRIRQLRLSTKILVTALHKPMLGGSICNIWRKHSVNP